MTSLPFFLQSAKKDGRVQATVHYIGMALLLLYRLREIIQLRDHVGCHMTVSTVASSFLAILKEKNCLEMDEQKVYVSV